MNRGSGVNKDKLKPCGRTSKKKKKHKNCYVLSLTFTFSTSGGFEEMKVMAAYIPGKVSFPFIHGQFPFWLIDAFSCPVAGG